MEARRKEAEWEGEEGGAKDELVTGWRENESKERRKGGGKEGVHSWVIQHRRSA